MSRLKNSMKYFNFMGQPFSEKILQKITFPQEKKNKICIFSHFDKNNIIDDNTIFYLQKLSIIANIIFVSTSEKLNNNNISKLKTLCNTVIIKENNGYDFGAWKSGLNILSENLFDYDELILCNDSVLGPLFDLEPIFNKMKKKNLDIWSITDSYEKKYHLQSFFVVYTKNSFSTSVFKDFWDNFKIYIKKGKLIKINEIQFSQMLKKSGLKIGAYCRADDYKSDQNIMHYHWRDLIKNKQCPFLKKELIRDNPKKIDITGWKDVIKKLPISYEAESKT